MDNSNDENYFILAFGDIYCRYFSETSQRRQSIRTKPRKYQNWIFRITIFVPKTEKIFPFLLANLETAAIISGGLFFQEFFLVILQEKSYFDSLLRILVRVFLKKEFLVLCIPLLHAKTKNAELFAFHARVDRHIFPYIFPPK